MTSEDAKKVRVGDALYLEDTSKTPGRKFDFPFEGGRSVSVKGICEEPSDHLHFDIGEKIPIDEEPLMSRDTGAELCSPDGRTYWMHPSRFGFLATE